MNTLRRMVGCLLLLAVALGAGKPALKTNMSFELITEPGLPLDAPQKWYELFADLGVTGLRIRSAEGNDKIEIDRRGKGASASYKVTGLLRGNNTLQLPGGKFTLHDSAKLKQWIEKVADEGAEGVTQPRSAFGLTTGQLEEVDNDLKQRVTFSTKGLPAQQVLEKIGRGLRHSIENDPGAERALTGVKVEEDLLGISSGTALAAVLRPAGLVLTPERPKGATIQFRVGKPVSGRESWPIGWNKAQESDAKLVPKLFEFIDVEITETPLIEAVAAIEERLKIPFLWDHNAMALHGIDPAKIQVKLPKKKLTYSLILQKILAQGKLKKELRADEAGKTLMWITTLKPAS